MELGEDKLRFGPFQLSRHQRALLGPHGPVPLGGRAFDLLAVLAANQGRLFSKHELIDRVWPGLAVEENNLHVQMVALRRALGGQQNIVQTVPGRGYRLVADDISETPPPAAVRAEAALTAAAQSKAELAEAVPAEPVSQANTPPGQPAAATQPAPTQLAPTQLAPTQLELPTGFTRPSLIGRDQELADLRSCIARHRLVTITGPSGIGKTQMALAVAVSLTEDFAGFVRIADFAPVAQDDRVEATMIAAFGLRLGEGANRPQALGAALGERRVLLILDNCEHRLGGIAPLAEALLKACPGLSLIATSQEPLRLDAEAAYRLTPLSLPPAGTAVPEEIAGYGAVALFLQRVEAADRNFRLDSSNAPCVVAICRDLDGIPLALEMAAARVPALGLEGLHSRLHKRLRLLTSGRSTAAARHRTLRATIAWSEELLDPGDRRVFHRLGVFTGTFSAAAAAAILKGNDEDEWSILDALGRLVDKSLVVAEAGSEPRYRLLETPRLFALEQLTEAGGHAVCIAQHAGFYAALVAQAYASWETTDDAAWLMLYKPELDNVRAATDWALGTDGDVELGLLLASAGALLWDKSSMLAEGRRYLETAERLAAPPNSANHARLYREIGNLWFRSDRPRALAAMEQSAAMYHELGLPEDRGAALALAGLIHSLLGATEQAKKRLNLAYELLDAARRPKTSFNIFNDLGMIAAMEGDFAQARGFFEQALRLARRVNARHSEVNALINLAEIEFNLGEIDLAVERANSAISYLRAEGRYTDLGWALVNVATYLLIAGRLDEARLTATEALALVAPVGGFILRVCLQQCALLAACAGELAQAARLLGFVDAAGEPREPTEQQVHEKLVEKLQAGLSPAERRHLAEEGAAWSEQMAAKAAAHVLASSAENAVLWKLAAIPGREAIATKNRAAP